jgi:microcystin-dependent protein
MDAFLGQIALFAFPYAPKGWTACTGQILPIQQNQALFAIIGTTYGGDGKTTFALPNLQGKEPVPGLQYCINLSGVFPQRD